MKNLFIIPISLILISFTIPIETKISIPKIPSTVSTFFCRNKEEICHKEFNDIKTLEILCEHGPVFVETWKQPCVLLELRKKGSTEFLESSHIHCLVKDHTLQATTKITNSALSGSISLHVLVPKDLPVKITTTNGAITVKKVCGALDLSTIRGAINILYGTNTVIAKTVHGHITVTRKSIQNDHALNLYSEHGSITLSVPQNINAELEAHSQYGKIFSDLFVTLLPQSILLNDETFKKMRFHVHGFIGQLAHHDNSPTILLSSDFGTIKITTYEANSKKKK